MRHAKESIVHIFIIFMCLYISCTDRSVIRSELQPGIANVSVILHKPGILGKIKKCTLIQFDEVVIDLRKNNAPFFLSDTIPLSGTNSFSVMKTYSNLEPGYYSIRINSTDTNNITIHESDVNQFEIIAGDTTEITFDLLPKYSTFNAHFYPIQDSINRCLLLINDTIRADTVFPKQSLLGDTVTITFDYLPVKLIHRIKFEVYGDIDGINTLMYSKNIPIQAIASQNENYNIHLDWVGPDNVSFRIGHAAIELSLGEVSTLDFYADMSYNPEFKSYGYIEGNYVSGGSNMIQVNEVDTVHVNGSGDTNFVYFVIRDAIGNFVQSSNKTIWISSDNSVVDIFSGRNYLGQGVVVGKSESGLVKIYAVNIPFGYQDSAFVKID